MGPEGDVPGGIPAGVPWRVSREGSWGGVPEEGSRGGSRRWGPRGGRTLPKLPLPSTIRKVKSPSWERPEPKKPRLGSVGLGEGDGTGTGTGPGTGPRRTRRAGPLSGPMEQVGATGTGSGAAAAGTGRVRDPACRPSVPRQLLGDPLPPLLPSPGSPAAALASLTSLPITPITHLLPRHRPCPTPASPTSCTPTTEMGPPASPACSQQDPPTAACPLVAR